MRGRSLFLVSFIRHHSKRGASVEEIDRKLRKLNRSEYVNESII